MKTMTILKYRHLAFYPWCVLEAEIKNGNEIAYVNIDLALGDKIIEREYAYDNENHHSYLEPLDEADTNIDYGYDYPKLIDRLVELWNNNPVFEDNIWKDLNENIEIDEEVTI